MNKFSKEQPQGGLQTEVSRIPKDVLRVRLNEPFQIRPDLNDIKGEDSESIDLHPIKLEVEGVGKGEIRIIKYTSISDYIAEANLPQGRLTVQFEIEDGQIKMTDDSAPLEIGFKIEETTADLAHKTRVSLIVADEDNGKDDRFDGDVIVDEPDSRIEGMAAVRVDNWTNENSDLLDNEEGHKYGMTYFPQDPALFDKMWFVIKTE